ncbi:MAG: serine/threonine-protein kinase [Planctomycetota bacterium]|nr:serine/threonine-protein kinase [Planctomycetota bacterium]MDA1142469.1 serine/threonine-protein kinase [Planctomycetota bacterium]
MDTQSDELLVKALEDLFEQKRQGKKPDLEAATREHPDLGEELRELWAAAVMADELGSDSTKAQSAGWEHLETVPSPDSKTKSQQRLPETFGNYEILGELGRGGMGVVYRARQESLDRTVALKVLLKGEMASSSDVARFRMEAESAAHLDHPNIVPVYEVGEEEGRPYFTMRIVEGETLSRRLQNGPISSRESAELLLPICRGIQYAHERGVLHRDLKPSNIIIDSEGTPYVTDFGLARRLKSDAGLTHSGAIIGTPGYMSPEQAAGTRGTVGRVSDVYGLGAILYHSLTGRPPFSAVTPVDTVLAVLEQDPVPIRLLNSKVDTDLEMVVMKCLQKPQDLRFQTAADLADDLQAYLDGEPVSARTGGIMQVMSRVLRETHHASVLENWGLLWMWHSVAVFCLCLLTDIFRWNGITSPAIYIGLWTIGLGAWVAIFWALRHRAGPITFVERQIAHIWGASILANAALFVIEILMGLPALKLSPIIALFGGSVFFIKAGILSGRFYFQAAALYLTAGVMALAPDYGVTIFGAVTAVCFFVPGLKYYQQSKRASTGE